MQNFDTTKKTPRRLRRRRARRKGEPKAIDLIEEGMHLLKQTSLNAWAVYLSGASPFVFAFLFYWTEMATSGLADQSLFPGAMGLGILFIWFKVTQAFFYKGLHDALHGVESPGWTAGHWAKTLRRQAFWQPTGLVLLPVAFVVTLPFARAFSFYQNLLMSDPSEEPDDRTVRKESWRLAKLWPEQNWVVLTLLSLVYLLSFVNWLTLLMTIPFLLKTLLGIETAFSRSGIHLINSTSLFVCCLLAYLVTDPLVKAVYLLRRHYCKSQHSGADLLLRLKQSLPFGGLARTRAVFLTLVILLPLFASNNIAFSASGASAPHLTDPVDPAHLDASIDKVLERREFAWRFPREKMRDNAELELGWLKSLLETLERWAESIERWFDEIFGSKKKQKKRDSWDGLPEDGLFGIGTFLSYALIAVFVIVLIYFIVRALRTYQPVEARESSAAPGPEAVPDLNDENVAADLLPRNRWLEMAREQIANGELRLALRAYFLAQLSALASEGLVVIRLAKSNRDYANEISRRAHGKAGLLDLYRLEMRLFESAWYGDRRIGMEEITEMERYLTKTGVLL